MLLAVDVGNTQTVIGLYGEGEHSHELVDHWRVATKSERTCDEHALLIQEFLAFAGHDWKAAVSGVAVSSGVPTVTYELRRMCERYLDIAKRGGPRYLVIDATRPPEEVSAEARARLEPLLPLSAREQHEIEETRRQDEERRRVETEERGRREAEEAAERARLDAEAEVERQRQAAIFAAERARREADPNHVPPADEHEEDEVDDDDDDDDDDEADDDGDE